mmetsp:Transcript_30333/g.51069  ORF Transcript_30333/g.51069 Transcript_30333/m.51069 type:complete len:279 (+) Transcript_30333:1866-2702(+)
MPVIFEMVVREVLLLMRGYIGEVLVLDGLLDGHRRVRLVFVDKAEHKAVDVLELHAKRDEGLLWHLEVVQVPMHRRLLEALDCRAHVLKVQVVRLVLQIHHLLQQLLVLLVDDGLVDDADALNGVEAEVLDVGHVLGARAPLVLAFVEVQLGVVEADHLAQVVDAVHFPAQGLDDHLEVRVRGVLRRPLPAVRLHCGLQDLAHAIRVVRAATRRRFLQRARFCLHALRLVVAERFRNPLHLQAEVADETLKDGAEGCPAAEQLVDTFGHVDTPHLRAA